MGEVSAGLAPWRRARAAVRALPGVDHAVVALRWASRSRMAPLSRWGFERGTPVDRWYIERFLDEHRDRVRGHALEVLEDLYASALGAERVDVVDIDAANSAATVVGDLCAAATLPPATFDVVVLTQTLQFLTDPRAAVCNAVEALRPGGTLLLTVPSVSRVADGADRWRWTPTGLGELLAGLPGTTTVRGAGNLVACRAFLMGLAVEDLPAGVLEPDDPAYPLIVTARLDKPAEG